MTRLRGWSVLAGFILYFALQHLTHLAAALPLGGGGGGGF